jgi:hypothetical protein
MTTEETVLFKNLRIGEKFIFPDKPKYYNMRTNNGANSYIHLNGLNRGCSYNPFSINSPVIIIDEVTENIKPKEKTLKERIEEEFPDKDVIMLEWFGNYPTRCLKANGMLHIDAQSTEAFAGYVYALNNVFKVSLRPCIWDGKLQKYIQHPVAVLLGR